MARSGRNRMGRSIPGRITAGIEAATDFVLFWSAAAAQSEWVRLEVNMAFIFRSRTKAIRLRVIKLDATPLPLYLEIFHGFRGRLGFSS